MQVEVVDDLAVSHPDGVMIEVIMAEILILVTGEGDHDLPMEGDRMIILTLIGGVGNGPSQQAVVATHENTVEDSHDQTSLSMLCYVTSRYQLLLHDYTSHCGPGTW